MTPEWKIGNVTLQNRVVAAPLAGVSNPAFRAVLKEFGPGLMYSEMTSDKALIYKNRKTMKMIEVREAERPVSLQLFGSVPEEMGQAAEIVTANSRCDIIDINMGCPMTKVVRQGSGSMLMQHPELAADIVRAVKDHTNLPVTVKIRAGWDKQSINAPEMAVMLENAGADAIAVHGRTRSQIYEGFSDWGVIKAVRDQVTVPVIGNGDLKTPEDAKQRMEETGVDAIMIGRGMLGNPWLIRQTAEYLETGAYDTEVSLEERFTVCRKQARALMEDYGELQGMKMMRSHACWYVQGMSHANQVKARMCRITKYDALDEILTKYQTALETGDFSWFRMPDRIRKQEESML